MRASKRDHSRAHASGCERLGSTPVCVSNCCLSTQIRVLRDLNLIDRVADRRHFAAAFAMYSCAFLYVEYGDSASIS